MIFDRRVFACYTQWGGYNSVSWFYDIGISMQKKFGWTREKGEIPGAQKICGLLEVVKKGKKAKTLQIFWEGFTYRLAQRAEHMQFCTLYG